MEQYVSIRKKPVIHILNWFRKTTMKPSGTVKTNHRGVAKAFIRRARKAARAKGKNDCVDEPCSRVDSFGQVMD